MVRDQMHRLVDGLFDLGQAVREEAGPRMRGCAGGAPNAGGATGAGAGPGGIGAGAGAGGFDPLVAAEALRHFRAARSGQPWRLQHMGRGQV